MLFTVLHCPVDILLLCYSMHFTAVFFIKCLVFTPMLLLPLLYECSVTTVLLSGANERRHHQMIGPSLTPSPRTIDGRTVIIDSATSIRPVYK